MVKGFSHRPSSQCECSFTMARIAKETAGATNKPVGGVRKVGFGKRIEVLCIRIVLSGNLNYRSQVAGTRGRQLY